MIDFLRLVSSGGTWWGGGRMLEDTRARAMRLAPLVLAVLAWCVPPAAAQDVTAPSVPTVQAQVVTCSRVDLAWLPSTDQGGAGVRGYKIYRNGFHVTSVLAPATSLTQSLLAAATTYTYAVSAVDNAGNESAPSAPAEATTPPCPDRTRPSVPTGLTAIAVGACDRVDLAWNAATDSGGSGLGGYRLYRDDALVAEIPAAETSTTDFGLTAGMTYAYAVSAIDGAGNESPPSLPVHVTTPPCSDRTPPPAPAVVFAVAVACNQVQVGWLPSFEADGTPAAAYVVYRNGLFAAYVPEQATSVIDVNAAASTTYQYTVTALDAAGNESAPSFAAAATTPACPDTTPPSTPTNFSAVATSCSQVALSWGPSVDTGGSGLKGYRVYRNLTYIGRVVTTATTDTDVVPSVTYSYEVAAVDYAENRSRKTPPIVVTVPPCANRPPTAAAGPDQTALTLTPIPFSAAGSQDPDGTIVAYGWSFGDGATATGATAAHAYPAPGTYTVTLTVTDDGGLKATDTATVRIANRGPLAAAGPDRATTVETDVAFDGRGSSDADGRIVDWSWSFGDGGVGSGATVGHRWSEPGTYVVTLTVTDDAGARATDAATITVTRPVPTSGAWARTIGDVAFDEIRGVATDAAGNVVVTGQVSPPVDIGGIRCTGSILIAAYDPSGMLRWVRCAGGLGGGSGRAVALDPAGNVVVTGYFRGSVDFGGATLSSEEGYDAFLAKYSPAGTLLWSRRFGGPILNALPTESGNGLAVDAAGNILLTGMFEGTTDFGGGPVTSAGQSDAFLAKFAPNGAYLWSKVFGGQWADSGNAVGVDASGNVLVTGTFLDPVDFGGGILPSSGFDAFVAKYSPAGAHLWSRAFGGTLQDVATALAVGPGGSVVVSGTFNNVLDVGLDPLRSAGGNDVFVIQYSSAGAPVWGERLGSTGSFDAGTGVVVDRAGSVHVVGTFSRTLDFGAGTVTSAGSKDAYLATYAANGAPVAFARFGSVSIDQAVAVGLDGAAGAILVGGSFFGTVDFGSDVVSSAGDADAFLLRIVP